MSDRLTPAQVETLRQMLKDRGELGDLLTPGERSALTAAIAQAEAQMPVRKEDTPEARKIWADVDKAAERAPERVQAAIRKIEALPNSFRGGVYFVRRADVLDILRDVQEGK